MESAILILFNIIEALLPLIGGASSNSTVATIVGYLEKLLPLVEQFFPQMLANIQNIATILMQSGDPSDSQMATLVNIYQTAQAAFEKMAQAQGYPADPNAVPINQTSNSNAANATATGATSDPNA